MKFYITKNLIICCREIVDKTVLKVVETENLAGTVSPRIQDRLLPGYESDTSSRSAPVRSPATLHRPSNTYDLKQVKLLHLLLTY